MHKAEDLPDRQESNSEPAPAAPRPSAETFTRAAQAVARMTKRTAAAPPATEAPAASEADRKRLERSRERWRRSAEARGFAEDKPDPAQGELLPKPARTAPKRPAKAAASWSLHVAPGALDPATPFPSAEGREAHPVARLAYAAVIVGDRALQQAARLVLVTVLWRYRPGRALSFPTLEIASIHGLRRTSVLRALKQAEARGHILRLPDRRGSSRIVFPVIEDKTGGLDWLPAEQLALPGFKVESSDARAVAFFVPKVSPTGDSESPTGDSESPTGDSESPTGDSASRARA